MIDLKKLDEKIKDYQQTRNQRLASEIYNTLLDLSQRVFIKQYLTCYKKMKEDDREELYHNVATSILMRVSNPEYHHNYWTTAVYWEIKNHIPYYKHVKKMMRIAPQYIDNYIAIHNPLALEELSIIESDNDIQQM